MCGRIWVNWLRREYSSYKCPQSSPLLKKQGEVVPHKIPKRGVWILCWVIGCIMLWVNWPVIQNSPYKSWQFSIWGQLVTSHWSGNIKNTKTSSHLFMTGIHIIKVFLWKEQYQSNLSFHTICKLTFPVIYKDLSWYLNWMYSSISI